MAVLLCATKGPFTDLLVLNLTRRGYAVSRAVLDAVPDRPEDGVEAFDIVVADPGLPGRLWCDAARVRSRCPRVPLILLGDDWPNRTRLRDLQPCIYVRKPFSMDELLMALRTV